MEFSSKWLEKLRCTFLQRIEFVCSASARGIRGERVRSAPILELFPMLMELEHV